MTTEKIHPGHALLRALVPSPEVRRAFVSVACASDTWRPSALIAAVHDGNRGPDGRVALVNVTPGDAALVRAFIESI